MSNTNTYDEIISNLCVGNYKSVDDYSKFSLIVICMHTFPLRFDQIEGPNLGNVSSKHFEPLEKRSFSDQSGSTRLLHNNNCQADNIIHIPVHDSPDECIKFLTILDKTRVLDRMHQCITNNQPVLVHCHAGMQRSCAVVACYLMKHHHMTMRDAMDHIRSKCPIAFFGGANFQEALEWMQFNKAQK